MYRTSTSYGNLILLILIVFSTISIFNYSVAQNYAYNYTHFDIDEGLPSSETYFAYQDTEGYMWFTTDRGIVKYDGYEFQTFTEADGLAELVNFKLHKDPRGGFITIGKEGKITTYKDGVFKPFEHNDSLSKISYDTIIATYHFEISHLSDSVILLKPIFLAAQMPISHYYIVNRNTGNIDKVHVKNIKSVDIPEINDELDYIHKKHNNINRLTEIRTNNKIKYYLVQKYLKPSYIEIFKNDTPSISVKLHNKYKYFYIDSYSRKWLSTQSELFYSNTKYFRNNLIKVNIPSYLEISSIIEDNYNNIWVMTINGGIVKISISNWLKQFPLEKVNKRILKLYANQPYLKFYSRANTDKYFGLIKDTLFYLVKSNEFYTFVDDKINKSTYKNKYEYLAPLKEVYRNFRHDPFTYPILNIDRSPNTTAIEIFNHVNIKVNNHPSYSIINSPYVYDFKLNDTILILGTAKGLFEYQIKSDMSLHTKSKKIITGRINEIHSHKSGKHWVATLGGDLYYYTSTNLNPILNPFHKTNSINAIEVTNDSIAYIGTSRGLFRLKYTEHSDSIEIIDSYWFGKTEGLSSSYVSGIEKYNGNIFIGTLKGLYYFNDSDFSINTALPKLHIDNIKLIDNNTILKPDELTNLKSHQNNIQIKYTGLYFLKEPQINYYRYTISQDPTNDEPKWIYTNNRSALLNDLSPGEYTFTVQCRNNNNIWSDSSMVEFSIAPHLTQTWLFRVCLFLLLGLGVWAYFRSRTKRMKHEQEIQNEMLNVKMQSTRNQMNPHFVFNGMNAIQNFIFKGDKRSANRYISKFSALIRDSLKMAHMEFISLKKEINFVDRYLKLEKERFPEKFDYSITVDSSISEEDVLIPPLLVQTLAENAVKHAFKGVDKKGIIQISYEYDHISHLLYIKIADNGIGLKNVVNESELEEDDDYNKFGLRLLQRRIKIFNQKNESAEKARFFINYFNKRNQSGTLITIIIPTQWKK